MLKKLLLGALLCVLFGLALEANLGGDSKASDEAQRPIDPAGRRLFVLILDSLDVRDAEAMPAFQALAARGRLEKLEVLRDSSDWPGRAVTVTAVCVCVSIVCLWRWPVSGPWAATSRGRQRRGLRPSLFSRQQRPQSSGQTTKPRSRRVQQKGRARNRPSSAFTLCG